MRAIRVWDLPTRIVHWALAAAFLFSWCAAKWHNFSAHRISGLVVLGLVTFRLIWGVVGSDTARFTHFVRGPRAAWTYARTLPARAAEAAYGHNPLGGWSVVAMLLALIAQVGLGLFAVDTDGLESGPLSDYVGFDTGRRAAHLHHLSFNILLALVALHVAAVAFYALWKRRNLVLPMITGRMSGAEAQPGGFAGLARASIVAAVAAATTWLVSRGLKF